MLHWPPRVRVRHGAPMPMPVLRWALQVHVKYLRVHPKVRPCQTLSFSRLYWACNHLIISVFFGLCFHLCFICVLCCIFLSKVKVYFLCVKKNSIKRFDLSFNVSFWFQVPLSLAIVVTSDIKLNMVWLFTWRSTAPRHLASSAFIAIYVPNIAIIFMLIYASVIPIWKGWTWSRWKINHVNELVEKSWLE